MADAHLNGSLNLPDAETVFRTVSEIAGGSVARIPDGETGERQGWIEGLGPKLGSISQLEEVERTGGYNVLPVFRIRDGEQSEDIVVPELGYASAARHAYSIFARLRDEEHVIAPETRFQVSLPTVIAGFEPFIAPRDQEAFEPVYVRRLRREVEEILTVVPSGDLAIQWDVAVEMAILEGVFPARFEPRFEGVVERLALLSSWIPDAVPLGYHLCYGDAQEVTGQGEGRHWKEPEDMAKLVAVANGVTERAVRPLSWFSMPVPLARGDDAYFEPLADLRLHGTARLYLGLVHHQDGVEGTQRRIEAARRYRDGFGVATECGMGRKPSELVPKLLQIQRDVRV